MGVKVEAVKAEAARVGAATVEAVRAAAARAAAARAAAATVEAVRAAAARAAAATVEVARAGAARAGAATAGGAGGKMAVTAEMEVVVGTHAAAYLFYRRNPSVLQAYAKAYVLHTVESVQCRRRHVAPVICGTVWYQGTDLHSHAPHNLEQYFDYSMR